MPKVNGSSMWNDRNAKARKRQELYVNFMEAISDGDSAKITACLKQREKIYFDLNQDDGKALQILLANKDYVNAAKLLDAGVITQFLHQDDRDEYDSSTDCCPSFPKGTEIKYVDILEERGLSRDEIYEYASEVQQKVFK